jgi:hypothetical protein
LKSFLIEIEKVFFSALVFFACFVSFIFPHTILQQQQQQTTTTVTTTAGATTTYLCIVDNFLAPLCTSSSASMSTKTPTTSTVTSTTTNLKLGMNNQALFLLADTLLAHQILLAALPGMDDFISSTKNRELKNLQVWSLRTITKTIHTSAGNIEKVLELQQCLTDANKHIGSEKAKANRDLKMDSEHATSTTSDGKRITITTMTKTCPSPWSSLLPRGQNSFYLLQRVWFRNSFLNFLQRKEKSTLPGNWFNILVTKT